jgi:hypothetical protein
MEQQLLQKEKQIAEMTRIHAKEVRFLTSLMMLIIIQSILLKQLA